jgi:N-acetylmuramoyl-L-alanine amidase
MYDIPSRRQRRYDDPISEADQFWDTIRGWFTSPGRSLTIIPRAGWGAKNPRCQSTLKLPVRYVFIHHTAGSTPSTESAEKTTMQRIQKFHQGDRGWCDIAYNFVIMPSGRVYEGRGWRRVNGATKGYNSNSLAFCWAGNYDNQVPTPDSIATGRVLLQFALDNGYLMPDFALRGHRDAGKTACPGKYLYPRLRDLDPRK